MRPSFPARASWPPRLNNLHRHTNPANLNYPRRVYGEYHVSDQWLGRCRGIRQCVRQSPQAGFGGWRYRPLPDVQPLYLKILGGVVHGYRGQYRDNIPLNHSGFAPVVIPSVGYCISRVCSEVVVGGGAGMLLTFGVSIP